VASLYKKYTMKTDPRTGFRRRTASKKWYIKYRDGLGRIKRVSGATDKSVALQIAAKLEKQSQLTRAGVLDEFDEYRMIPLADQLLEFRDYLENKGNCEKHVRLTFQRASVLLAAAKLVFITDVKISKVTRELAELRRSDDLAPATCNHYLTALKEFFNWMVRERRWPSNPIAAIEKYNVDVDRRRVRRAVSVAELNHIFAACLSRGFDRPSGLSGDARIALYYVAAYTGLRRGELASLTRSSFELETSPPTVTVVARNSKRRKLDRLPLHPALVKHLEVYFSALHEPSERVPIFPVADVRTAEMLERDLDVAEIPYQDAYGAHLDFHALRHSFVSNLARVEPNAKRTQSLARHSTMDLTMMVYAHSDLADQAEAISKLPAPSISGSLPPTSARVNSEVRDEEAQSGVLPGAQLLAGNETCLASIGTADTSELRASAMLAVPANLNDSNKFDIDWHQLAVDAAGSLKFDEEVRPAGIEPATCGLEVRCSIQLSYGRLLLYSM